MRLIDIEPFETEANITSCYIQRTHSGDGFINVANTNTKEIPTIDAVPVVRCKECKHHHWEQEPCHGKTVHLCDRLDAEVTKDFFCSYGERRGDG